MKNWMSVACLLLGAGLAFASAAKDNTAKPATSPRAGTVVEIKPDRIYLIDIARAGDRLVAVGQRGFALLSDDSGKTWRAVGTPVVRTLTGVAFNGDKLGVAVGHGGSLVRTEDGGESWVEVPLDEAMGESLLGVVALGDGKFAAYGAFGMYFDTSDGGKSWTRRMVIEEYFEAHISQVVPVGDVLWMVGETGTLARSEDGGATWAAVESPYEGSFFGIVVAQDGSIVLFGMRGSVYRSADGGATWQDINIDTTASFNGGRVLSDGRILLVGNGGLVAVSTDNGQSFDIKWSTAGRGFSALVETPAGIVTAGEAGVSILDTAALVQH